MQNHVPECHGGFIPRGETEEAFTWIEAGVVLVLESKESALLRQGFYEGLKHVSHFLLY